MLHKNTQDKSEIEHLANKIKALIQVDHGKKAALILSAMINKSDDKNSIQKKIKKLKLSIK